MMMRMIALSTVAIAFTVFGISWGGNDDHKVKPHTRLLYNAGGGTNVWFFSYMRCRMRPNEDYTFRRYRVVNQPGKVYYENGGVLEIYKDRMVYMGVTNFYRTANGYVLTATTNYPNHFIRSFD